MNNKIALAALLVILVVVNVSIFMKEKHLSEGKIVFLELAPVDPRSLMQGDYMALRFTLERKVSAALKQKYSATEAEKSIATADGHIIVTLDNNNVASFKALHDEQNLSDNEYLLRFRIRNRRVKFATNAFFFQEGHAKYYQNARYGQFRVNKSGDVLLTAMFDKNLKKLVPAD